MGNPRPNTMARGEAMTPVPEGVITTTDILQQQKKKYEVELIMKRRVKTVVEADSEEDACKVAQEVYATGNNTMYDEFILGPDAMVKEL